MDRLLISVLSTLFIFGWSGMATFLYFAFLMSGIVQTTYATLSTFTLLTIYYFYGLIGTVVLTAAVTSMICAGAMFWFDMSFQDIQDQAQEMANQEKENQEPLTPGAGDDEKENEESKTEYMKVMTDTLCEKTGVKSEQVENLKNVWGTRYQTVSTTFDTVTNAVYGASVQLRELTEVIPIFSGLYGLFDYVWDSVSEIIKSIISLKDLSKLSRDMAPKPGQSPFDLSALEGLLGAMPDMPQNNATNELNRSNQAPGMPGIPSFPGMPNMMSGMPGLGGFDMNQMAEIEKNMTPDQKKQVEQAAMNMLGNMDMSQMGDMMSMFGMGPPGENTSTTRNPKIMGEKKFKKNNRRR